MSSSWPIRRLADVVECLDGGRRPVRASDRRKGLYPYYGASGVVDHVDGYLFEGTYALVAEDGENLRSRKTPIAFLARDKFWVNNHAHILAGTQQTDVRYLAHRLQWSDVGRFVSGSTQPKLTQDALLSMTFPWPPITTQRAIADVLGVLEDKIETALRIARLSEELAIAHVGAADEVSTVGAFADAVRVQISATRLEGRRVAHFSLHAFDSLRLPEICQGDGIKSGKFVLESPAVLVSKLNPHIPRVWCAVPPQNLLSVASTEFVVLRPKLDWGVELLWAACAAPSYMVGLVSQVAGTTGSHQRVRPEDVLAGTVANLAALPRNACEAIVALVRQANAAREEAVTLAKVRDALAPAVLSGDLQVRELAGVSA